jgi:AraC-like DNA-binding protein
VGVYGSVGEVVEAASTVAEQRTVPGFAGTSEELDTLLAEGLASKQLAEDAFWVSVGKQTETFLREQNPRPALVKVLYRQSPSDDVVRQFRCYFISRRATALTYAKEHLSPPLSVAAVADAAFLSPRQFSRLFREETGLSPAKAIEWLRVESARLTVEAGRFPIEEIASKDGFGNRERMRRSFVRAFGRSPQAIQRAVSALIQ